MNIIDFVVGKPIKTTDERAEQIGPAQGVPIFGLDALSSAAYGPEAALSLLIPLGLLGVRYIVPISAAIITLLVIVYFSYRQTIAAYPSGGGSYTVARFNLGTPAPLLAAAALLADYILTAAVGISAGVGALVSAVPSLLPHTVSICVGVLIVITILNLRGVRDAGLAFAVPTYLFVGTLLITIVVGVLRVLLSGGHPTPAAPLPPPPPMIEAVGYWLLLKVFASGCTALTGVEAVSNGVNAFREPAVKNAQRTLTVIIFILAVLLAGISYLVKVYGIAADPVKVSEKLAIPYWFMNADDFVRLFGAAQGVQRPVLLEALRLARNEATKKSSLMILREELLHELNRILALAGKDEKTSKDLRDLAKGLITRLNQNDLDEGWAQLKAKSNALAKDKVTGAIDKVKQESEKLIDDGKFPKVVPADVRKTIRDTIDPILVEVARYPLGGTKSITGISADTPSFFDKQQFRARDIEQVLSREESGGARARDFSGTMLLRIDRLLADRRFEFLLGPVGAQFPNAQHSLATFLRDLMGLPSRQDPDPPLSDEKSVPKGELPFYDRQRSVSSAHRIVVVDLNLLAAEVLENVTALIGRVILEFLQRLGETGGEGARGSLPTILVLEEAQNYIRTQQYDEEISISRAVFERIAREGRKYGLGLVVASQRPSELSKTVLSQCSSFVVHRLQNPEDLRYFKEIVPAIFGPLLDQLPALAPQTALVLGECVRAPAIVRIREARPVPRSRDPKFFAHWTKEQPVDVDVENVCALWEEKAVTGGKGAKLGTAAQKPEPAKGTQGVVNSSQAKPATPTTSKPKS